MSQEMESQAQRDLRLGNECACDSLEARDWATAAVRGILRDLRDRHGVGAEIEAINQDTEILDLMVEHHAQIIREAYNTLSGTTDYTQREPASDMEKLVREQMHFAFGIEVPNSEYRFFDDGHLDRLDLGILLDYLSDETGMALDESDLSGVSTVGQLATRLTDMAKDAFHSSEDVCEALGGQDAELEDEVEDEEDVYQWALVDATHRHYKGGLYRLIGTARHTENGEELAVYEHLWPHARGLYVRPLDMFNEVLENGVPRFLALNR